MNGAIGKNRIKTALIVGLILGFLYVVVYFISLSLGMSTEGAFALGLIISGIFSIGSYWFSDKIVLSMSNAHPANDVQDKMLKDIIGGLIGPAGLPMPKIYVVNDASPNAFATGRSPKKAVVCVTTGLLQIMDRDELEGVLAHELSHIKNYDILLQTVASVMIGAAIILSNIFSRSLLWGGGRRRRDNDSGANIVFLIIGLLFAILAPLAGQLMKMALSRSREYLADATAAQITKKPEGLASALEKLGKVKTPVAAATNATEGLYISNPLGAIDGKKIANIFSTHPPIDKRIEKLRNMK